MREVILLNKNILAIGIIFLLVLSALAPMAIGYNDSIFNEEQIIEYYVFNAYNVSELSKYEYESKNPIPLGELISVEIESEQNPSIKTIDGPMDSPWSMYCHDVRHTGRSPYSTADNPYTEKWKFWTELDGISSGIVVSDDGTIYFSGSYDFYAVHPNGTQKWRYGIIAPVLSCPAIDEDGTIYVGTAYVNTNLNAINPNGTLKWKFPAQIFSSPAIGDDGTIYFGDANNNINALYPNGTLRWRYKTNHVVYSSPAIGVDGTVYCGSHDCNMYALYPNNGTLKWKYPTGHWIRTSPCIADNGAIYFVSLDNYLYAVWPNGTLRWKTNVGAGTSPTIGHDGTIYAGYTKLHAVNPNNGSVKWTFDVEGKIRGATPCNSIDGTIYLGNSEGSDIVAVNPDGTEKWRKYIGGDVESPPAIGEDGTVYIGSRLLNGGYLHAFGPLDPDAPNAPTIDGRKMGRAGTEYDYTFKSTSPLGNDVFYYIEWGDGNIENWIGPYDSGEVVTRSHSWSDLGTYTIKARAKDSDNLWGPWGELTVTIPRNRATSNVLFYRFLEHFPLFEKVLSYLIKQ